MGLQLILWRRENYGVTEIYVFTIIVSENRPDMTRVQG